MLHPSKATKAYVDFLEEVAETEVQGAKITLMHKIVIPDCFVFQTADKRMVRLFDVFTDAVEV